MLVSLRIKNLALVADLTLELRPGYNVITGETGAGKSILIGALNLLLGQRAERSLLRAGADHCSVEAVFDLAGLRAPLPRFLDENGLEPCEAGQLLLKRTLTSSGANRQFINGSPATLNLLAALGEWLVDIHGPHEHQSLLHSSCQLRMLDAYGKLDCRPLAQLVTDLRRLEGEKNALIVDEKTYAHQLDLLRFQVNEISGAQLQPESEGQLEDDYRRANNGARLLQLSQRALELLSENDAALLTQAALIGRTLQDLQRFDSAASFLVSMHQQGMTVFQDLQDALSRYAAKIDLDPARLEQLEQRINLVQSLKRKYGATVAEVVAFGEEARRKLQSLEQRDAELTRLNAAWEQLNSELWRAGRQLSRKRQKILPQLAKAVSRELAELGFRQSRFDISLSSLEDAPPGSSDASSPRIDSHGLDRIEFQFAPNPGEPARPLRAIASSGELARVMLALKTVLAAEDQIPVLVFDEVDANIGGETANAVGLKMQQIARDRQVLCITHLPQVAAAATAHFVVTKESKAGRTTSEISLLDPGERVTELARMLGGQTEAARKHAEALIGHAS